VLKIQANRRIQEPASFYALKLANTSLFCFVATYHGFIFFISLTSHQIKLTRINQRGNQNNIPIFDSIVGRAQNSRHHSEVYIFTKSTNFMFTSSFMLFP
jgi:hypothetical protein